MTPEQAVRGALSQWYDDQKERGIKPSGLPRPEDLELIVISMPTNRDDLSQLTLADSETMARFATGIIAAVKSGVRQAAAEPNAPAPPAKPFVSAAAKPERPAQPADAPPPTPSQQPAAPPPARTGGGSTRTAASRAHAASASTPAAPKWTFALYDLTNPSRPGLLLSPEFKPQPDGRMWIGWTKPSDAPPATIFRVVSRDDRMPISPDDADVIGTTTSNEVYDPRPLPPGVRHVQIWMNAGASDGEACAAQPILIREGILIPPPVEATAIEDSGTVVLSWKLPPGVRRIDVSRMLADASGNDGFDESEEVYSGDHSSWRDTTCRPGDVYDYQFRSIILDVDGNEQLSDPVVRRVRVAAMLVPVLELRCFEHKENGRTLIDLQWDHPVNCEVDIYRTKEPPERILPGTVLDITALGGAKLSSDDKQVIGVTVDGSIGSMPGVTWPAKWPRIHLTAVTHDGKSAMVGATLTRSRTTAVTDARIVERVYSQLLTFAWPPGASSVYLHETPIGTTHAENPTDPIAQVLETEYKRDGGKRLNLPPHGCEIHLVPATHFGGTVVYGDPVTAHYPGLLVLRYDLAGPPADPAAKAAKGAPPPPPSPLRRIQVTRVSDEATQGPPTMSLTFTLVATGDRFPLAVSDVRPTEVLGAQQATIAAHGMAETITLQGDLNLADFRGRYLRLFASAGSDVTVRVALLDPPLGSLRVP